MHDARRLAYLDALGVEVYVRRGAPDAGAGASTAAAGPATPDAAPAARVVERAVDARVTAIPAPAPRLEGVRAADDWATLRGDVAACERCELHRTRSQTVFGVGNPAARWMFIGEAPGQEEDRQGEPFVGCAVQFLNAMIRALGMRRDDVFIANVLKCRPPGNRDPRPAEAASCRAFLERQVALVDPTLVVAVGRIAAQDLLATETPIAKLRGKVHSFGARPWPLVVTYHPAYLLRSPGEKRKAWHDLLQARQLFERLERERGAGARP